MRGCQTPKQLQTPHVWMLPLDRGHSCFAWSLIWGFKNVRHWMWVCLWWNLMGYSQSSSSFWLSLNEFVSQDGPSKAPPSSCLTQQTLVLGVLEAGSLRPGCWPSRAPSEGRRQEGCPPGHSPRFWNFLCLWGIAPHFTWHFPCASAVCVQIALLYKDPGHSGLGTHPTPTWPHLN